MPSFDITFNCNFSTWLYNYASLIAIGNLKSFHTSTWHQFTLFLASLSLICMIHIVDNIKRLLHLQELGHHLIRNKYTS